MKLQAKTRLLAKVGKPLNSKSSGTYVCALPDNKSRTKLVHISSALGHPISVEESEDLHSTVIYSKGAFPSKFDFSRQYFGAKITGLEFWDGHDNDGYVVVTLDSPDLTAENRRWTTLGLKHSFEDYTPHVTLFSKIDKTEDLIQRINRLTSKVAGTTLIFDQLQLEGLKIKE